MNNDSFDEQRFILEWHLEFCSACGCFVQMAAHTEERCERTRGIIGNLIGEVQRTEVPQAFYKAFEGEPPFQCEQQYD